MNIDEYIPTREGYLYNPKTRKVLHRVVWEKHNGPIPDGMIVHHINKQRADNRIENLECLTPLVHSRLHSGFVLKDDVWYKRCRSCHDTKPLTSFHRKYNTTYVSKCKLCTSKKAKKRRAETKKIRRETDRRYRLGLDPGVVTRRINKFWRYHKGEWWKRCTICRVLKRVVKDFYQQKRPSYTTSVSFCKKCNKM